MEKAVQDFSWTASGELLGLACGLTACGKRTEQRDRLDENPNKFRIINPEVRPQPPHCDKNSYFLDHLLSSVTLNNK
jgi:hypothetical protein